MNKKELMMEAYEAPRVKVIEVEVEQGYSVSGGTDDWTKQ